MFFIECEAKANSVSTVQSSMFIAQIRCES